MRKHTAVALCMASLILGMYVGACFVNRNTLELCQLLSERARP